MTVIKEKSAYKILMHLFCFHYMLPLFILKLIPSLKETSIPRIIHCFEILKKLSGIKIKYFRANLQNIHI